MAKSKKNKNKPKLNLTVRDEQRNKLEQMASLENRSLSNLIEVMADERWERLAEQQGIAYAKTVAEAMNLNSTWTIQQTARNCAEQFSILWPVEKCQSKKAMVEILSFSLELGQRLRRGLQRANNLDCRRTSAATESVSIAAAHKGAAVVPHHCTLPIITRH
jgi:hypothetical protein